MSERFRTSVFIDAKTWPEGGESASNYVRVSEDLLSPKELGVAFSGGIYLAETLERGETWLGSLHGLATIHDGVTSIYRLEIDCIDHDPDGGSPVTSITGRFLERIPVADLCLAIAARCSLTRWQDAHYVLEPVPRSMVDRFFPNGLFLRQLDAMSRDEPLPVKALPKPVLVDEDGFPWYRVQVISEPARQLSRSALKRARITPEYLRDVWTVYRAAQQAGEPSTEAVREWAEIRTGRTPSNPTIFRWIQKARKLYGEEAHDAQDQ